jgi:hypothetical protein
MLSRVDWILPFACGANDLVYDQLCGFVPQPIMWLIAVNDFNVCAVVLKAAGRRSALCCVWRGLGALIPR